MADIDAPQTTHPQAEGASIKLPKQHCLPLDADFATLADFVPQLVWMCMPDGLNIYFNRRWVDYTGLTLEESYGRGWNTPFHPDDKQLAWDAWNRAVQSGGEYRYSVECRLRAADGSYRRFLIRGEPMCNTSGGILRWLGTCTDVEGLRQESEQALLRSEKLAAVGRMAAAIAHEINNPLEAVTNLLYLVKEMKDLPEHAHQYLEIADAELKRVAHTTRQSLGFYREGNAAALTSVNAMLDSAVDLLKSKISKKQAVIEKEWDGDVEITAVAGELRQVFSNLLANSLDAIDEGGTIKLRVSTVTAPKNGHRCVRVTIADNGKGIPASSRRNLFEPFYTTKGTIGTGLGLWVTKQIVDSHEGTIQVRSTANGSHTGTVFSIVLPAEAVAASISQSAGA